MNPKSIVVQNFKVANHHSYPFVYLAYVFNECWFTSNYGKNSLFVSDKILSIDRLDHPIKTPQNKYILSLLTQYWYFYISWKWIQ